MLKFDQFTIALLIRPKNAPKLTEAEEDALQDAHLAHLAKLHDEGILLAAGPLLGDSELRGLSIFKGTPEEISSLEDDDPAIRAGRLAHRFLPWMVPAGAVQFSHTRLPRSMTDVKD